MVVELLMEVPPPYMSSVYFKSRAVALLHKWRSMTTFHPTQNQIWITEFRAGAWEWRLVDHKEAYQNKKDWEDVDTRTLGPEIHDSSDDDDDDAEAKADAVWKRWDLCTQSKRTSHV